MKAKHIYQNPEKYSKNNALQYNFAMKTLSKLSFELNSRVLDIGCGDGVITQEIAKIVATGCVIGTDISYPMIEHASKKYIEQENLRFLQMDASNNLFRDQFDIITSFNCLHWVNDQQAALTGIARAAASGAQIALLLSHRKSTYHFVLEKLCASEPWKQYFINFESPRSFFEVDTYKTMVKNSNLTLLDLSEEEMIYHFESKDQLKEFFNAAGSQIKAIPEDLRKQFLDDFADEFITQLNCNEEDPIPLSFWCLQIVAAKPTIAPSLTTETKHSPTLFAKL